MKPIMQSYEFEVMCKIALIKALKEKYNEDYILEELHLVWFSKVLRNFKCVICDLKDNRRIYECTYNGSTDELYVDIYDKQYAITFDYTDLSDNVTTYPLSEEES